MNIEWLPFQPRPHKVLGTLAALAGFVLLSSAAALAGSAVDVAVDLKSPGQAIPTNFIGLSYEMSSVCPARNGEYLFSPENRTLIRMFQTLGVHSLRVGGNTADRVTVKIPDRTDIDSLFGFCRAAGVKVIYTLRLNGNQPSDAADTAKYIMDHYRQNLTCFALGNEPDKLLKDSAAYVETLRNYMTIITAATNAPEAVFCGPNAMQKNVGWANDFAAEFAGDKRVALVTQHEYPGGSGRVATNAVAACRKLLSPGLLNIYEKLYRSFVPAVYAAGRQYRLEEANSFSNGGAAGASDAFASSLWALDYMYWWAAHDAAGINFHTGAYVDGTRPPDSMKYVVFWNSPDGYAARPIAYALKAFDIGSHGRLVPIRIASNADHVNLRAYGVLADDGSVFVTLINKETSGPGDATVSLAPGSPFGHGQCLLLTVPGNEIAATSGVTLGGAPIQDNGAWSGQWTPLAAPLKDGHFLVNLPGASAAVVHLTSR